MLNEQTVGEAKLLIVCYLIFFYLRGRIMDMFFITAENSLDELLFFKWREKSSSNSVDLLFHRPFL